MFELLRCLSFPDLIAIVLSLSLSVVVFCVLVLALAARPTFTR
jgi:hypothetical protein